MSVQAHDREKLTVRPIHSATLPIMIDGAGRLGRILNRYYREQNDALILLVLDDV